MQKLIRAGKDNTAIMAAMANHMPAFHQLLSTALPSDIDDLCRKFPGFYRYARILESLAGGIRSGAVPVPGRQELPRQAGSMADHRSHAAAIDLRMRQLAEEGVPHSAIIDRMTAYVVDLGKIWNATTDEQLAALCAEYPGFRTYAGLMEEAAEAERRKPTRRYDGLPELPDAVKDQLSSLLSAGAKLQRDYQSVLDTAGTSAAETWLRPLSRLHAQWETDLTRFRATLQGTGVSQIAQGMILPVLDQMAEQITSLKASFQAT